MEKGWLRARGGAHSPREMIVCAKCDVWQNALSDVNVGIRYRMYRLSSLRTLIPGQHRRDTATIRYRLSSAHNPPYNPNHPTPRSWPSRR